MTNEPVNQPGGEIVRNICNIFAFFSGLKLRAYVYNIRIFGGKNNIELEVPFVGEQLIPNTGLSYATLNLDQ